MAASRLLFDFIESLIIVYFIIAYFSLPKKGKNTTIYFIFVFLVELLCDVLNWNGFQIGTIHFFINIFAVYKMTHKMNFSTVFVILFYECIINLSTLICFMIYCSIFGYSQYVQLGLISFCAVAASSKMFLLILSMFILKATKMDFSFAKKRYFCVIISEMTIMVTFSLGSYKLIMDEIDQHTLIYMLFGLVIVFLCNIVYMVCLSNLYKEKMDFEKKTQKIYYLEQGVQLIKNIHFDTYQTNHRLFYVMKKLKQLAENDHNEDALKIIDQFEHEREMTSKLFSTNNPYFDMIVSIKINELIERHILIKPQISLLPGDKYKDIAFINHIVSILNYIKDNKSITLHIKDQGVYFLVEMYSKEDFYKYDQFLLQHLNLLIKSRYQHENDLYIARFLLGDSDNE